MKGWTLFVMDDILLEEKKKEGTVMVKTKRVLSIFLVVMMLFTSLPLNTFAEGTAVDETIDESEVYVIDSGEAGENAVWILNSNGELRISGTGDLYTYTVTEKVSE